VPLSVPRGLFRSWLIAADLLQITAKSDLPMDGAEKPVLGPVFSAIEDYVQFTTAARAVGLRKRFHLHLTGWYIEARRSLYPLPYNQPQAWLNRPARPWSGGPGS